MFEEHWLALCANQNNKYFLKASLVEGKSKSCLTNVEYVFDRLPEFSDKFQLQCSSMDDRFCGGL